MSLSKLHKLICSFYRKNVLLGDNYSRGIRGEIRERESERGEEGEDGERSRSRLRDGDRGGRDVKIEIEDARERLRSREAQRDRRGER